MTTATMDQVIREEARLIILKSLALQVDERLNSSLLLHELERVAIRRERAWLHAELDWLAEIGAVTLIEAGSVKVATLTERGARHLDRSLAIEGIKRPARPGS